jgi:phosphatidylglycerol:prolipoprotein diacylglycerol transferase
MRPVLFRIPIPGTEWSLPVFSYGVLMLLAVLAGTRLAVWRARRAELPPDRMVDLGIVLALSGLVGGRLLYLALFWREVQGLLDAVAFWHGGLVLYGGIFTGFLAFLWCLHRWKLPLWKTMDVAAPSIALAIGIGRLGCFMTGCCWGDPSLLPWAVSFPFGSIPYRHQWERGLVSLGMEVEQVQTPQGSVLLVTVVEPGSWAETTGLKAMDRLVAVGSPSQGPEPRLVADVDGLLAALAQVGVGSSVDLYVERADHKVRLVGTFQPWPSRSLPVHPTQLYEFLAGVLLAAFLASGALERWGQGATAASFFIGYGVDRFLVEFLRDDMRPWALELTLAQWISIGLALGGAVLLVLSRTRLQGR